MKISRDKQQVADKPEQKTAVVFVRNMWGKAINPTKPGKAYRLVRDGKAVPVCAKPYTIQMLGHCGGSVQPYRLGLDSGYSNVGASVINERTGVEVLSMEIELQKGQKDRNTDRKTRRHGRRNKKCRHRAARFDNRRRAKGKLAPSIQHKLDTHVRIATALINEKFVPISRAVVEGAQFDIQKIKNPNIEGVDYQQGDQAGFWNLREYVFHRDEHKCQNPDCKHKKEKNLPLQVHHLGFWKGDSTDRPGNLITLCVHCHRPQNHAKKGFLYGWEPKLKNFRPETFMSTIY